MEIMLLALGLLVLQCVLISYVTCSNRTVMPEQMSIESEYFIMTVVSLLFWFVDRVPLYDNMSNCDYSICDDKM